MNSDEKLAQYYIDKTRRTDHEAAFWWTVCVPIIVIVFGALYIVNKAAELISCL